MTVVDGKKIAQGILDRLRADCLSLGRKPQLGVVLVGDDKASAAYVRNKQQAAEFVGIQFTVHKFDENTSQEKLIDGIRAIHSPNLDGLIIQLPLPARYDKRKILNLLDPSIDVDCLSWISLGKLVINDNNLVPPSPGAILEILKHHKVSLKGKHVVLVGQGDLIGKPLTNILIHLPVTLTSCNRETKNLAEYTRQADILITAVGKHNLIRQEMVKKGAVVIDAGVSFARGKMYGDVDFDRVAKKAGLITPTPGGVGPITVAKLLENTVIIAKAK